MRTKTLRRLLGRAGATGIGSSPSVLILGGTQQGSSATRAAWLVRALRPRATVHTVLAPLTGLRLDDERTGEGIYEEAAGGEDRVLLAAQGPFDLIVDLRNGKGQGNRLRSVFYFLRPGGVLALRDAPAPSSLATLLDELASTDAAADPAPTRPRDNRPKRVTDLAALRDSVEVLPTSDGWSLVRQRSATAVKLREHMVDAYLARRGSRTGRVLEVVPAQRWEATNELRLSDPERGAWLPRTFDATALSLREHLDVTVVPRSGAVQGNVALAESFDHAWNHRLTSKALIEWAPNFVKAPARPDEHLDGTWFHLDHEWRPHFGHTLRDQITKLWAWPHVLRAYPDARVLMSRGPLREWERTLWSAVGIDPDRITVIDEPVQVERLLTATAGYRLPQQQHPIMRQTYQDIATSLAALADPEATRPERLFLSRRTTYARHCTNPDEIHTMAQDNGYTVVHPEDYPLGHQVAMMRSARSIAGFSGSGLHQVCFARPGTPVICIGSDTYTATVEPNNCALLNHPLTMAWLRADTAPPLPGTPEGQMGRESFRSNYTFDRRRDGDFLQASFEWAQTLSS